MTTRRTKDQIARDRLRISELLMQQYTHSQIAEILSQENGYELSRQQVTNDIHRIRESWLVETDINYDAMINQELARLDSLEAELWRQLRDSNAPTIREIIDEYVHGGNSDFSDIDDDDDEVERVIQKISTMTQTNPINPAYFAQILNVQKERRKILGLYAPSRLGVVVDQQITVKGYSSVSPDDWPSPVKRMLDDGIVDGEVVE